MYCPGIKSNIKDRVCNYCGIYYLRITTVKRCRAGDGCESNSKVVEETEFKEVQDNKEAEEDKIIVEDEFPIINIFKLLKNLILDRTFGIVYQKK